MPGRSAGGHDWQGWHLSDDEAIGGLAEVARVIAPAWWRIVVER